MTESPDVDRVPQDVGPPAHGQEQAPPDQQQALVVSQSTGGGLAPLPVSGAIRDLLDAGVRGQSGMLLLYSMIQRFETDIGDLKASLEQERRLREDLKDDLSIKREENAVLRVQLKDRKAMRKLQNVMITLGGIVAGSALPSLAGPNSNVALGATLIGALLMLLGWLPLGEKRSETT